MTFQTGTVFGNRYTLGELIAVGGMGEVWRATDRVLGRTVAIKLLSPSLAEQPGFTRRFREEARHTAQLVHENIAAVFDYGEDAGASWLVMELVEGEPLSQVLKNEGPLQARRVSSIMAQAASGLQAAHDAGVIHRDVKPANILIRHDGQVKLTDFGIARAIDAAPITRTGEVMGTAQYISPEQAMGRPVSPASDIYSLGVVAHEMLTGNRPFDEGSPVATAMAHIHNAPPPLPPGTPQPLAGVVLACLAKDPKHRPGSAADVAAALLGGPGSPSFAATQVLTPGQGMTRRLKTAPQPVSGTGPMTHPSAAAPTPTNRRNPWLWIVPLLVLLAIGAYLLAQSGMLNRTPTPAPSTPVTTSSPSTPTTTTPTTVFVDPNNYLGMSAEDARAQLAALGLKTRVVLEPNADVPDGRVISVSPNGDVMPGSLITLRVSSGPPPQTSTSTSTTPSSPDQQSPPTSESQNPPDTGNQGNGNNGAKADKNPGKESNSAQNQADSSDSRVDAQHLVAGGEVQAHEGTVAQ